MKVTINEANRKVQQLREEISRIRSEEQETMTYAHSEGEDPFPLAYDFVKTQKELDKLNAEILKIRHAVSQFNVNAVVPRTSGKTVDSVLIAIAMLNEKRQKLSNMLRIPEVRRENGYHNTEIIHRNFDNAAVQEEYDDVLNELNQLRAALDLFNLTEFVEIDI